MLKKKKLKKSYNGNLKAFLIREGLLDRFTEELAYYLLCFEGLNKDKTVKNFFAMHEVPRGFYKDISNNGIERFLYKEGVRANKLLFEYIFSWEYYNERGMRVHYEDVDWMGVSDRWAEECSKYQEQLKKIDEMEQQDKESHSICIRTPIKIMPLKRSK